MKKQLLLVDGMALLFRGFFATSFTGNFMRNEAGVPTNGVQQFLKYFISGINTFKPTHVIVCWDMGSTTFRTEMYPNYKANRSAPPEELIPQFDMVNEAVSCFDIPNIGMVNYEADDLIGSIANTYKDDFEITIQTGDLDMLQLVEDHVQVAIMRKGIGNYDVFHHDNFFEKKGLHAHQIIDFKGLTGDTADNYPGIKGIGEKTATKLLNEHGTVDAIYEVLESLTPGQRNKFETCRADFDMSRELATISCDLEISVDVDDAVMQFDPVTVNDAINDIGIPFTSVQRYYEI